MTDLQANGLEFLMNDRSDAIRAGSAKLCTDCGKEIEEDFNLCPWNWCRDCYEQWKE